MRTDIGPSPMRPPPLDHRFLLVALALMVGPGVRSQDKPNSPVFKYYKPPEAPKLVEPADMAYRLWEEFMLVKDANKGDPLAQHELGVRYILGRGFEADTAKAAYWIARAAGQNLIPARFNLGILQNNGWGTPWNPFEAFRNFQYAAEHEMSDARYALGMMYLDNLAVPRSEPASYRLIKLAADSGYAPAVEALREFHQRGLAGPVDTSPAHRTNPPSPDSVGQTLGPPTSPSQGLIFLDFSSDTTRPVDDSRLIQDVIRNGSDDLKKILGLGTLSDTISGIDTAIVRLLRESGERGSPEPMALLGRCYERGIGVRTDTLTATMFYLRAYRLESPLAAELLLRLSYSPGYFELLKRAIDRGNADAMFAWASLLGAGYDHQLTGDQAIRLLQRAIALGHVQSMIEGGLLYSTGRWVHTDRREARKLWRLAAGLGSQEARLRLVMAGIAGGGHLAANDSTLSVLQSSVRDGSILAQIALGTCYETGYGVARNRAEAARYYRAAATRGSQIAYRSLQRLYDAIRPPDPLFRMNR